MTIDDQDNVFMGAHPSGNALKYNPTTGETTSSPRLIDSVGIIRSLCYHDGYVYANGHNGTGKKKLLFKLDAQTLQIVAVLNLKEILGEARNIGVMSVAGDMLIGTFISRQDGGGYSRPHGVIGAPLALFYQCRLILNLNKIL